MRFYDMFGVLQLLLVTVAVRATDNNTYRAAVYEHVYQVIAGNATATKQANLRIYEEQASAAKLKEADIIVFPEYGITGPMDGDNRSSVYDYIEVIPEPNSNTSCMSCDNIKSTSDDMTSRKLGCIAKTYHMYLVANFIENATCSNETDSNCPPDGHYQYNTNVVFNRTGCLIAKYHKFSMWGVEEVARLDHPSKPEVVTLDTELGRLGTEICFDLAHAQPGMTLVADEIDTLLFPTDWPVVPVPVGELVNNVVQYSSGWARRMDVNILVANIHKPSDDVPVFGSAISTPKGVSAYYYDNQSTEGKLLIADIPRKPRTKGRQITQDSEPRHETVLHTHDGDIAYKTVDLEGIEGTLQVCDGPLCCSLIFRRESNVENYKLVAWFNNDTSPILPVRTELCMVHRCSSTGDCFNLQKDDGFVLTKFSTLVLSGTFTADHVFPVMTGGEYVFTDIAYDFQYEGGDNTIIATDMKKPLLTAALTSFFW